MSRPESIPCQHFRWRVFCRDGVFYADGRGNTPSLGKHSLATRDHAEAMRNLAGLDRKMAARNHAAATPPSSVGCVRDLAIAEGWTEYLQHSARPDVLGGTSRKTQQRYRAVRDKHLQFSAAQDVLYWQQVNKRHIEEYGAWLARRGYADGTVYLELTLLKQVLSFLIDEVHALPEAARVRLTLRRSHDSDTYCPSRAEIQAMLSHCGAQPDLQWLAVVIKVLAMTGMRIAEVCALRWSDVDLNSRFITMSDNRHSAQRRVIGAVRTMKNRRGRRIPICDSLVTILTSLPRHHDGHVLHGPRGGLLKPDTVRNVLIRDVLSPLKKDFPTPSGEIGFEHTRLHSFRHYFVSKAFADGATEAEVKAWVGHADSRIVRRYLHVRTDDALRRMSQIHFLDEDEVPISAGTGASRGTVNDTGVKAHTPKPNRSEAAAPSVSEAETPHPTHRRCQLPATAGREKPA